MDATLDVFTREELWALRLKAEKIAACAGINPMWARCYWRLADAADHLDGMMARCEVGPPSAVTADGTN